MINKQYTSISNPFGNELFNNKDARSSFNKLREMNDKLTQVLDKKKEFDPTNPDDAVHMLMDAQEKMEEDMSKADLIQTLASQTLSQADEGFLNSQAKTNYKNPDNIIDISA